ncbi:uncharacterized protein RSE6_13590 [Rhynchosporium secalis]|uniref:Uncharacterized protein n=1 Tax=Rhynchosporium secalis TaxID=38038 RepID=A0A1E1MTA4_RHYSE|nr:uncharacterized protein RSE6_13590 [Rhynchosporium secalis]
MDYHTHTQRRITTSAIPAPHHHYVHLSGDPTFQLTKFHPAETSMEAPDLSKLRDLHLTIWGFTIF